MDDAYVDATARLDVPLRMLQGGTWSASASQERAPIRLPDRVYIGPFATIGCGVVLGDAVVVDAYCSIDPDVIVGDRTLLIYRASVGSGTTIGSDCVIGGFIPESTRIGDRARIMGHLIHTHGNPTMSWDHREVPEVSPTVEEDVFVGFGAKIIGDLTLHCGSYVAAGAVVTRSVPSHHIAFGVNKIVHRDDWKGPLRESPFFEGL